MNKIIAVLISIMTITSCDENSPTQNTSVQLKQNYSRFDSIKKLDPEKIENENLTQLKNYPKIDMKILMISSGQFSPYTDVVIANCKFQIVQNQKKDTIYLSTNDNKFVTPDGYKVGDDWEIITKTDAEKVERMPGWGYYIQLESGWQLGFCEGQSCTDNVPKKGSLVKWILNEIIKVTNMCNRCTTIYLNKK